MCNFEQFAVRAEVLTLEKVDEKDYQFSIPCYQRPYVWPDDDVKRLFLDIKEACKSNESHYFIGTTLTSILKNGAGENVYELIDGQQRTTTLMLLAIAFEMAESAHKLAKMATFKKRPRLQFDIREPVQQLLGSFAKLDGHTAPGHEVVDADPYLERMNAALTVLKQQVEALSYDEREQVATFIYEKVQWVNNVVAHDLDLNRLFATMNTAGIQLEQTDILKSKLLKQVPSEKPLFDAIWMACEHLDNYFERNVRKVFNGANWNHIEAKQLAIFDRELFVKQEGDGVEKRGLSLAEILATPDEFRKTSESEKSKDSDLEEGTVYCRSIITFPLLLIHTYRIYRARTGQSDIEQRLYADKLLEIFDPLTNASESEVKAFIQLLWQVRYQFDRWVVKWIQSDDTDDEQLRFTSVSRSQSKGTWYLNRTPKELSALVMLQSVRNFTGERSAQYWLTPFIAGLITDHISDDKKALQWLEQIDNELSLAADGETQKIASFKQARRQAPNTMLWNEKATYFSEPRGTSFEHYWFQKLEYLLWKSEEDRDANKFRQYRITSKNSVEHVFPQHEEYGALMANESLNAFGNLALLSPGQNSGYSNQSPKKKKADFEAKPVYDSLKLNAIFKLMGDGDWTESLIYQHQKKMLSVFAAHYVAFIQM